MKNRGHEKDYWWACNRDAHAWVEAFDADTGMWVTVEPTPGMSLQRKRQRRAVGATPGGYQTSPDDDKLTNRAENLSSSRSRRNTFARRWRRIVSSPLLCVFGTLVETLIVARRMLTNSRSTAENWLAHVERKLRKHDLVRRQAETLHQFADRIHRHAAGTYVDSEVPVTEFAQWLVHYATIRYSDGILVRLQPPPGS